MAEEITDSEFNNNDFYFESDHLALRGNADYSAVLRTIAILQAQRIQATKDIDKIAAAEKEALSEPEVFLEKIIKGEKLSLPGPINIIEIPKINFNKYDVLVPAFPQDSIDKDTKVNDITVRGRVFDQTKPVTFNQLWTSEEQRCLEELLIQFPPEPIEMRRFAKIAHALGNRTTKQVASRCQKFFKKLYSAGMAIPGRLPKNSRYQGRMLRSNKNFVRPSTFFPSQNVPVQIPEDDDFSSCGVPIDLNYNQKDESTIHHSICVDQDSDNSDTHSNLTNDEKMLKLILRVKHDKEKYQMVSSQSEHFGFKCDYCNEEPIVGTRWKCITCGQTSIDFCSDCLITQLNDPTIRHPLTHKFVGYRMCEEQINSRLQSDVDSDSDDDCYDDQKDSPEEQCSIYDKDYMPQKFGKEEEYNYLDPNFLPE